MPIADNNGVNLHYQDLGQGEQAVVFINGLGLSGRFWFKLPQQLLNASNHNLRILCVDNRGSGRSSAPFKPYGMHQMADDLAVMLKHAGIDKAVLVGLSMGGMIAQHCAIRHPEKTAGLVLIATSAGLPHARIPHMATLKKLAELPFIAREEARKSLSELLLPKAEQNNFEKHLGGWAGVMREEKPRPHSFLLHLGAVATHYTGQKLQGIHCPTAIMTGDEDILVPPINSELLKARLPHAQLKELPGVGHAVEALAPEDIIASIQDVLNEASLKNHLLA